MCRNARDATADPGTRFDQTARVPVSVQRREAGDLDNFGNAFLQRVHRDVAADAVLFQPRVPFIQNAEPGIDAKTECVLFQEVGTETVDRSDGGAVQLPHQMGCGCVQRLTQFALQVVRSFFGERDGGKLWQVEPPLRWARRERFVRGSLDAHREPQVPQDPSDHRRGLTRSRVCPQHGMSLGANCGRLFRCPAGLSHRTGSYRLEGLRMFGLRPDRDHSPANRGKPWRRPRTARPVPAPGYSSRMSAHAAPAGRQL